MIRIVWTLPRARKMNHRPADLPDYEKPPLIEVVLGVQFAQLKNFGSVHFGQVRDAFRDEFPNWEDKPPLAPSFEVVGSNPSSTLSIHLGESALPLPRLWLINSDNTRLIQIQPDRLVLNWRKARRIEPYPRYEKIREQFAAVVSRFSEIVAANKLGELRANQCEITYINHIHQPENMNIWSGLHDAISLWDQDSWDDEEAPLEDVRFQSRHLLIGSDGEPAGRLLVSCQPAQADGDRRILVLSLSARGRPSGEQFRDVIQFLDWSREKIVRRFTSITTERFHEFWRRTQ